MKKLILLEFALLFLATTFSSNPPPPGWHQQNLPVNKNITDIFFLDSLKGWTVTTWAPQFDTGYILNTTNGGNNWNIQYFGSVSFGGIQFLDSSLGYAVAGASLGGRIFKTINGGMNWNLVSSLDATPLLDLHFVNRDTGWICSNDGLDGGVFKTTDGGNSWVRELNETYRPEKVFFINKDTGWVGNSDGKLYRTINGGINWSEIYDFPGVFSVLGVLFINSHTGWVTTTAIFKSTDSGFNWNQYMGSEIGARYAFVSDSIGWASGDFNRVVKTVNSGVNWFYQSVPIFNTLSIAASDRLRAWAGGSGIVHTTDGGPVGIYQIENEISKVFELEQNYPNPFNPKTNINFDLPEEGKIKLIIYDILGREIIRLVNNELKTAGKYTVEFNGTNLASGVYFYRLEANKFAQTKRMVLVK